MGGTINPSMILQLLKSQSGMGGGVPGGTATGSGSADEGVGPAMQQLQGADPEYALKLINNIKKQIADMIPTLAFRAPAAARNLVSCFKGLDGSIKELQQAQQTKQAVGGALNMSAIPQPQPPGSSSGSPDLMKSATQVM